MDYTDLGGLKQVQIWDVRGPTYVKEDWRPGERFRARLNIEASKTNTLESMLFNVGLVTDYAKQVTEWANQRLMVKGQDGATKDGDSDWNRPTTQGEVLSMWGYMVTLALNPSVPVEEAWRVKPQPGDLFPPLDIGKHGMHKNRFKKLRELMGMPFPKAEMQLDATDPWRYSRAPVLAFNQRRWRLVVPSWLITGDEMMSAWTGAEGVDDGIGAHYKPIPFMSFVERKPEPLGAELKVAADGNVGCFLNLEIQEGADAHSKQEYFDEYGHTTAVSLRLLQPWFKGPRRPAEPWYRGVDQPTRAYYGDSWFMGVNAAEGIHFVSGKVRPPPSCNHAIPWPCPSSPLVMPSPQVIYPLGDVKTNTSRFATEELRAKCGPASGDWATFTTEVELEDGGHLDMMAVAHRRGPAVHTFLSTCGLTLPGMPQKHKDDDTEGDTGHTIARKCPQVLNDATLAQPKIDRGNRRRQYDLAMEKRFRTEVLLPSTRHCLPPLATACHSLPQLACLNMF